VGAATFEWKSMHHAADVAPAQGLKSVDYSTLSKRLGELNYLIVKRIFERIVSRLIKVFTQAHPGKIRCRSLVICRFYTPVSLACTSIKMANIRRRNSVVSSDDVSKKCYVILANQHV